MSVCGVSPAIPSMSTLLSLVLVVPLVPRAYCCSYFGEILLWWGIFISCAVRLQGWTWFSIVGPVFISFLLLFVSGMPLLERGADRKYWKDEEYRTYVRRTSPLVPMPKSKTLVTVALADLHKAFMRSSVAARWSSASLASTAHQIARTLKATPRRARKVRKRARRRRRGR
jgi:hypothetical protein